MPTLVKGKADTHPSKEDEEVPFNEWAEGGDLKDADITGQGESEDESTDEDGLFEPKPSPTVKGKTSSHSDSDNEETDEEYEVTEEQQQKEEDEDFNVDEYVDEVQMKREEDAAEAKDAKKGKHSNLKVLTTTSGSASKRKTTACSPAAQMVGGTPKKKATAATGPKSANAASIYKQVNVNSNNRRTCNRMTDASISTPERNNRWVHRFKTRVTLKLRIPATEKPEETLSSIVKEFVQELRKVDNTSAVLPWNSSETRRIIHSNDVPTSASKMRKYLKKFYVGKPNQELTIYPGIFIGHNLQFNELRELMQDWLDSGNHSMFYMMLQAEDSVEVGWLLYTTREMDAGAMADELADLVGIKVGLRWKVIDIGVKGKIPDAQKVQALTVEVETKYRWEAQQKLTNYFGRTRKDICEYPNGVRVRFVKNRKDALNSNERGKLDRLRARQQLFLSKIQSHETWSILQLDYSTAAGIPTLRQMIMGLTVGSNDTPLFHSVDLDWKGVGYVFQFSPDLKAQAECTIHTLLPLLQHHFPHSGIEANFTQETIDRCSAMVYDEATGTVIDPAAEESMKSMEDEMLPGFSLDMSLVEQQLSETRPAQRTGFPKENDSVSTLDKGTRKTSISIITAPSGAMESGPTRLTSQMDDSSIISSTSGITIETIHTIEKRLETLQNQVEKTDHRFNEIMNFLRQGNGNTSSSSGYTQETDKQDGTPSNPVTLDAGGNTQLSSGEVP